MTLLSLLILGHSMVLNGTVVPDTFCQGIAHDGTTYEQFIDRVADNQYHNDQWSSEVARGQLTLGCATVVKTTVRYK